MSKWMWVAILVAFWLACTAVMGVLLLISDHWWLSLPLYLIIVAWYTRRLIKDIRGLR